MIHTIAWIGLGPLLGILTFWLMDRAGLPFLLSISMVLFGAVISAPFYLRLF